jgi:hypothetical protein
MIASLADADRLVFLPIVYQDGMLCTDRFLAFITRSMIISKDITQDIPPTDKRNRAMTDIAMTIDLVFHMYHLTWL